MARIALRSYNREIENLIDRGQIEEAIAHAKNILKQYPRHVETYRLLGKAYLESQRYSEALDILQRVLSVIPDDFVAQLGMSIIREDEGNMDAAIWHMERAYEVQPFNRAVQDELRRLYGRRDGVEPPRIRLTRGSLVRMYARGELFPQAIAETRAALAEDPHRLDLTVMLSRLYYLSGQKVESAEIASALIAKLPFCMEANRILMEILPETSRAEEARAFQRKVFDLDPYAEFLTPHTPTSPQVPEQSVMVEHFEWQPSMQDNNSPDWARNIGLKWEEKKEDDLPDWLNTVGETGLAVRGPEAEEKSDSSQFVPDFMRDAGWSVSTAPEAAPPDLTAEEDTAPKETLDTAEMPDWLKSMAPKDLGSEPPADSPDQLEWLNTILPPAQASDTPATANQWTDSSASLAGSETQPAEAEMAGAEPIEADDIPDWLKEMGAPETPPMDQAADTTAAPSSSDEFVPSWMQAEPAQSGDTDEIGSRVAGVEAAQTMEAEEPPASPADELPAWLSGLADETGATLPATPVESEIADLPAATPSIETPLDEVNSTEISTVGLETESSSQPAEPEQESTIPEWLSGLDTTSEALNPSSVTATEAAETPATTEETDAIPAWLTGQDGEDVSSKIAAGIPAADAATAAEEPPTALPDWLKDLDSAPDEAIAQADQSPADISQTDATAAADVPDLADEPAQAQPPLSEQSAPSGEAPNLDDMDSAMAWLEALAAKQGADANSLVISKPEERSETPPGWVTEFSQTTDSLVTQEEPVAQSIPEEELPSWLRDDVSEETLGGAIDASVAPAADISSEPAAWLPEEDLSAEPAVSPTITEPAVEDTQPIAIIQHDNDLKAEPLVELPTQPAAAEPPSAEPNFDDMDSAMAWLEALAAKQGAQADTLKITNPEDRTETPPDWISQISTDPQPEIPPAIEEAITPVTAVAQPVSEPPAEAPVPDDIDSAMAWLEALAAKQGAESDSLKIVSPEDRSETPPDWIASLSKPEETAPEPPVSEEVSVSEEVPTPETVSVPEEASPSPAAPPAQTDTEIPDWLLNYEEEQKGKTAEWDSTVPATQVPAAEESFTLWLKHKQPESENPVPVGQNAAPELTPEPEVAAEFLGASPILDAQFAISKGDTTKAVSIYAQLIQDGKEIEPVIQSINSALDHHPVDVGLWQTLGDAYIRANKIQEALDAYTKAEELLR